MEHAVAQQNQGDAAFSKFSLSLYDALVLHLVCPFAWRCPNSRVLSTYAQHMSANHLDVGPGTGYFLDRVTFPAARPRLGLLDLNRYCLEVTARRVSRYAPEVYQANVLAPIMLDAPGFDSISANYVLHCLPGGMPAKEKAVGNLVALLNPGGMLFGATVLDEGVPHNPLARVLLGLFNTLGTLHNSGDSLADLRAALERQLDDVHVEVVGCVALFSGRRPAAA